MLIKRLLISSLSLGLALTLAACGGGSGGSSYSGGNNNGSNSDQGGSDNDNTYSYIKPASDRDWNTATLTDVSLSVDSFENMLNRQNLDNLNIDSILVVKDNQLVFEQYFPGETANGTAINYDKDTTHEVYSVSKSITSLALGIAIDQGFIFSVDDAVVDYLPDHSDVLNVGEKANLTLDNSLTMQAGFTWNELTGTSFRQFSQASDSVSFVVSQPLASTPGTSFTYNTGVTHMVGEVINGATGMNVDDYTNTHLFNDMNITNFSWNRHADGTVLAGSGLNIMPRDMAKIGQLMLNEGAWNGSELVSADWVEQSTLPQANMLSTPTANGYGYFWWLRDFELEDNTTTPAFFAAGYGGQYIYVLPELDMVVVFTSGNYGTGTQTLPHTLMDDDIMPSLIF